LASGSGGRALGYHTDRALNRKPRGHGNYPGNKESTPVLSEYENDLKSALIRALLAVSFTKNHR